MSYTTPIVRKSGKRNARGIFWATIFLFLCLVIPGEGSAAAQAVGTANLGANQVTLQFTSSVTGRGYFTLLRGSNAACGSAAQTKAGHDSAEAQAFRIGSLPLTANVAGNYTVKNLTESTAYTVCFTPDGSVAPVTANVTTTAATAFPASAWTAVGNAGFSVGFAGYESLSFSPDGLPYIAYSDFRNSGKAKVMKFDGTSWVTVGSPGFSAFQAAYEALAFSVDGMPYVAYMDYGNGNKATVMRFDGTSWVAVGSPGFSAAEADFESLSFSPDGTPYLAYMDYGNGKKATVMKFDGTSWVPVGSAGFSAAEAGYESLSFSPDGTPYLAYCDQNTGYKAAVMKFDGASWVAVGNAGFSTGEALYESMSLSPDGTPYVAYPDGSNGNRATVMKFDGTSWVVVGSPGFSTTGTRYESLSFSPDSIPYVAYQDSDSKATVMKFDGRSWTVVGHAGFSTGQALYESLSFSPDGTPYVAYMDVINSESATVMKLVAIPAATTGAASFITGTGATLKGSVTDNGLATTVAFEYGATTSYGTTTAATTPTGGAVPAGSGSTAASVTLSGLTPGTTYHFRINATANGVTVNGADATFTTLTVPSITSISPTSGSTAGGTSVILTGANLSGVSIVSFGTTAASHFTIDSATQITAVSPQGAAGTVDIVVTAPGGSSATSSAELFTFVVPPATGSIGTANLGANQVTLQLTSSATGRGYFTLLRGSNAACGSAAQTKAGHDSADAPAFRIGSLPLTASVAGNYTVKNLTASTAYTVCFTPDGNTAPVTMNVTTAAATDFPASAWTPVGNAGFSAGQAAFTSLSFSPDGTPYVAYLDEGNGYKATVVKFDGASWGAVGSPGFSAGEADFTTLSFSPDGTPYVAYMDWGNGTKATVMKFDGASWVPVGSPGFSLDGAGHESLLFSPDGTPYLAYCDGGITDRATVRKFDGMSWVSVGSPGFSSAQAYGESLSFSPDGTPYVAYTDYANGKAATVMKFDGASWVAVGSPGLSAGEADNASLSFSPDGTPYVAYMDWGNGNKATVMKFDGTSWVPVDRPGFSAGLAVYESLSFSPDGTPYVAYLDGSNGNKATVMKLGVAPAAATRAASPITETGATLNGTVNDNGLTTAVAFEYGTTTSYDMTAAATTPVGGALPAGSGVTTASVDLSGLTAGTSYHFRINATASGVTVHGNDATFTTLSVPSITFTVSDHTYGDAPFAVSASSPSAGAVTYSVVSGPASLVGSTVTLTGAGTVVLRASQAADGDYVVNTQDVSFNVAAGTAPITFSVPNHTYGDAPFAVTASSSSTGAFAYSIVSGPATIAGNSVTLTGAGTVVLRASQAADSNYTANTKDVSFTVAASTAPITFAVADHTYGDASFSIAASSSSTGSFTYSVVSGPASISGSTVTLTGAGTVVLKASQIADSNYVTSSKNASFTVSPGTAPITFSVSSHTYGDPPFSVAASSSSTGTFTYSVVSGPASMVGSTVTLTGAGTVVLKASQAADSNYLANTKDMSFTVAAGSAPITFTVPDRTYGDAPFPVGASSSSTGAFTYSVLSGPASLSGNTVTLTGAGAVTLRASQAADANYVAASKDVSFTVAAGTALITFSIANHTYGDPPFAVIASSASTGAYSYSVVSGPASISGTTVTLTGAGTVVLRASQAADSNYLANSQNTSFTVAAGIAPITFTVPHHTYGDAPFTVSASSVSTGAFMYSVLSGPATISGNTVTLTGAGSVTLKASQAADTNYTANSQEVSLAVTAGAAPITFAVSNRTYGDASFPVSASSFSTGVFTYSVVSGPATVVGSTVTLTGVGTVTLKASQAADNNYTAATKQTTFAVYAPQLVITANNLSRYYGEANPAFNGAVSGQKYGDVFLEDFSSPAIATSAPGTYSIVPSVSGIKLANYTVSARDGVLTVTQAPTITGVAVSATQIQPDQTVTLTIAVASATTGVPTGTVAITDDGNPLTTMPLSNGTVVYTAVLAPGMSHALAATYSGDTNYRGSSSSANGAVVTVAAQPFTFTKTGTAVFTAAPGTTAKYSFNIAPTNGAYPHDVTFGVTGLPSGAKASLSPSTITTNAGAQTVVLSVKLPQVIVQKQAVQGIGGRGKVFFSLLLLPFVCSGGLRRKMHGRVLMSLLLLAGLTGATVLTGCGSGIRPQEPASYVLTVTATSGTISQSQTVTLIVQ